jgi:hypothetical protein
MTSEDMKSACFWEDIFTRFLAQRVSGFGFEGEARI